MKFSDEVKMILEGNETDVFAKTPVAEYNKKMKMALNMARKAYNITSQIKKDALQMNEIAYYKNAEKADLNLNSAIMDMRRTILKSK